MAGRTPRRPRGQTWEYSPSPLPGCSSSAPASSLARHASLPRADGDGAGVEPGAELGVRRGDGLHPTQPASATVQAGGGRRAWGSAAGRPISCPEAWRKRAAVRGPRSSPRGQPRRGNPGPLARPAASAVAVGVAALRAAGTVRSARAARAADPSVAVAPAAVSADRAGAPLVRALVRGVALRAEARSVETVERPGAVGVVGARVVASGRPIAVARGFTSCERECPHEPQSGQQCTCAGREAHVRSRLSERKV